MSTTRILIRPIRVQLIQPLCAYQIRPNPLETVQLVEHIYLEDGFAGGGFETGALDTERFCEGEGQGNEAVAVIASYV